MRSEQVRLKRRLESLQKAGAAGNEGAAGEARLLAAWLDDEAAVTQKRADDRCKVIVGALVGAALISGRSVVLSDPHALIDALDAFLVRPAEREAILGGDGTGSEAFRRVFGNPRTD
uniref:hypothetical protein n=1 Tax=Pseudomonas sp. TaxID=306 RepID=UPI0010B74E05|nr:hypothetical protein [Pseudomonas sp.]QBM91798.1 mobilization protein MobC [Pseudomonas sp.]